MPSPPTARPPTGSAPAARRPRACARSSRDAPDEPRARRRDRRRAARAATARSSSTRRPRTASSPSSTRLHAAGARFTAVSEERGIVDFGGDDVRVVIDPIDGSLNAKRGLTHHALSIAVADGPTMADVVFGFVFDLGPGEEWTRAPRRGRVPRRRRRSTPPPERRTPTGGWRWSRSSRPTRAGWRRRSSSSGDGRTACARSGSIAISLCQVAADARRRDGDALAHARRRRRRRAAHRPRDRRRSSPSRPSTIRSARRWTSSRTRRSSPRARPRALAQLRAVLTAPGGHGRASRPK